MQALVLRTVITLVLGVLPAIGHAQAFPNGPINIVVPLAPGDAADTTVRLLAEEMAKALSTSVRGRPIARVPAARSAPTPWCKRRRTARPSSSRRTARSPSGP